VLIQLHSGVTTLRSVGSVAYEVVEVVEVADEIERDEYLGPRVLGSGPLLAITGGHGAPQIALTSDCPWEARRNARINLQRGVTAIKISATAGVTDACAIGYAARPEMTEEEMAGICEEAPRQSAFTQRFLGTHPDDPGVSATGGVGPVGHGRQ
jgi:imidazolonepropionase-like amidohydrolase